MNNARVVADIPFRRIPNHSELFLEYAGLAPGALAFYQRAPETGSLEQFARAELLRREFPRREIAAILRRQNALLGADGTTAGHIDALERPDSVAVVTGQQVGLFGGPLYTIYKAMTAIRLAEQLRARRIRAVPVFWMECEDHDLAEVTHGAVPGPDGALQKFDFSALLFETARESTRPVGSLNFPETIRQAVQEYLSFLPAPHQEAVGSLLELTYRPGAGFAESFGKLLARLFAGRGLVYFDPRDPQAKRLVSPLFRQSLTQAGEIYAALLERSGALQAAGFHAQVNILENSTILFFQVDGERKSLIRQGNRFALKNSDETFDLPELLELAGSAPQRFSPNVLLRPLVQDHLFPTAAYVGGPAEVAYFAQIEVIYRLFDRPMPAIWPRGSFTLLEPEIRSLMQESEVTFEDCLQEKRVLLEKLVGAAQESSASARVKSLGERLEKALEGLRPGLVATEASLGPALDTAKRKIMHNIEALQANFLRREAAQNSALSRRADLIANSCYPDRNLQEREIGVLYFLAKHGMNLLDSIYPLVEIDKAAHRILALE